MKTAITIPDEVYREAEQRAKSTGKSRSQLYTEAVQEYLARHSPDAITEALNRLCESEDLVIDPMVSAAGRSLLRRVEC